MAELDTKGERLSIKLVYYGPAVSGKTTNLMRLHDVLRPELKGEMMVLDTHDDRTLFFDLLPVGMRAPSGLLVKMKLYTVPGQAVHDGTRKAVLSRADGVVFVADSQRHQEINNVEAFQNLEENAVRVGLDFGSLPLIVQYNKRDLPNVIPEAELRDRIGRTPWPLTLASALTGQGVLPTFVELLNKVYVSLDEQYRLTANHGLSAQAFLKGCTGDASDG